MNNVDVVKQLIEEANHRRSVGSTAANADSSRSHSIMQFALKRFIAGGAHSRLVSATEPASGGVLASPACHWLSLYLSCCLGLCVPADLYFQALANLAWWCASVVAPQPVIMQSS